MLAARAAGAAGLHLDVLGADLDLAVVLKLGHDLDGGEARLATGVGIKRGDAHKAVHAVLTLEVAVGIVTLDEDGGGLDARLVAGLIVHELIGVAVALGPAGIHAVEHLRPVLRLGAAGAGVEGQNRVVRVVLAGEKRGQTALADLLFELFIALDHVGQLGRVVLLLRHLAERERVLPLRIQAVLLADAVLQTFDLLGDLLAVLQIVPEAVLLRLLLQRGQLLAGLGDAQRLLQILQRRLERLQLLFILVVFNDCHRQYLLAVKNSLAFLL